MILTQAHQQTPILQLILGHFRMDDLHESQIFMVLILFQGCVELSLNFPK